MPKWLIIEHGNKKLLAKQTSADTDGTVVVESSLTGERLSVRRDQVLATLPSKPRYGRVFGVLVEPLLKQVVHPYFGEVHLYRDDKRELAKLKSAMDAVAKRLLSVKIDLPSVLEMSSSFTHNVGKKYGHFKWSSRGTGHVNLCVPDGVGGLVHEYVLAHEAGHGVWYGILSEDQRTEWVSLFTKQAKMSVINSIELKDAQRHFLAHVKKAKIETVQEYQSLIGDNEQLANIFDVALSNVLSHYRLRRVNNINALLGTLGEEMFTKCWPKEYMMSEFNISVTEYGTTCPEEFFAEAFTFWLNGYKLHEVVNKLMSKHLGVSKPKTTKLEPLPEGVTA